MKLAFILDPLDTLTPGKDSSYAMMREADARQHRLYVLQQGDIVWKGDRIMGFVRKLDLIDPLTHAGAWYRQGELLEMALCEFDAVLMRKDPPFDMEYVYSTYLLALAEKQGAFVINSPQAIRDHNEKLAIMEFTQFIPPSLVTRQERLIRAFLAEHQDIILKPLDSMGGASIFRVHSTDHNLGVIIETLTHYGTRTIMAQRFLPEIAHGDKRILLIAGKPVAQALARKPKPGETRGNLAAGGTGSVQPLSQRDREIAEAVGKILHQRGLMLVGLDVIGDCLTEINVTSPTGMQEITAQSGINVAGLMIDTLENSIYSRNA
ncbi:MAG: glutathione synthase [Nitrosomonas sp.]|nr:glutathione synthase [Nitrosomonas sp.]